MIRFTAATALEATTVPAARKALIKMRNDPEWGARTQRSLDSYRFLDFESHSILFRHVRKNVVGMTLLG